MHAWDPYWVNPGGNETPSARLLAHLDALARLHNALPGGLARVRVDVGWSTSQPKDTEPDPDHYYHRRLRWLFGELTAIGVRPYAVIHQSPVWARAAGAPAKVLPVKATSITGWARWFAEHYAPWIGEIEVWNEPNLTAFAGTRTATPAAYTPVLKAFSAGARQGNSEVKLIGGNVAQCDWAFLDGCFKLGMAEAIDILGVHPYQGNQAIAPASVDVSGINKKSAGWEKSRISVGLPRIAKVMDAHGAGSMPVWATEVGWSASTTGVGSAGVPSRWPDLHLKSAAYIRDMLEMFTACRDDSGSQPAYGRVRLVTIYELFDPLSRSAHQKGFEIITERGAHRPAATAMIAFGLATGAARRRLY
jgi:hypothetical protein